MTTHSDIARRALRILLVLACASTLAAACAAPREAAVEDESAADTPERENRYRFARADLVDVATYVSDRTGVGFVIASPELRNRTLSLYLPNDVEPAVLEEMFSAALEAHNIVAEQRDGYRVIREVGSERVGIGAANSGAVTVDFREASVTEAAQVLALLADVSVIVTSDCPQHPITIFAPGPIAAEAAVELIVSAIEREGGFVDREAGGWIVSGTARTDFALPKGETAPSATEEAE